MNLKEIEKQTQDVYQKEAERYDKERGKSLFEKDYLDRFLALLPKSPHVLDLGCGSGEPIAQYLIEQGCQMTGTDYSEPMLEICRKRFPRHNWIFSDMRDLKIEGNYDGLISWGSFFHLNQDEQRKSLPEMANLLTKRGIMMITVGHEAGEVSGTVADRPVYHSSLSKEEYTQIITDAGLNVLSFKLQDPECHGFSVLIAEKI